MRADGRRLCSPTATSGSAVTRWPCSSAAASWSPRTAGSWSTSHPGAPASSPATSRSRPPTAGAGSSRGPPSALTPSRPWRHAAGLGRATEHRYGDRRWAVIEAHTMKTVSSRPRVPDEARLHLLAAQSRSHRTGRRVARSLLRPRVRDRAGQPLGPDPLAMAAVPDQPQLGLPGHPGCPRHRRDRCGAAAAGQAVDRLPEAARPASEGGPRPRCCTASSGSPSPCSSRPRSSSSSPDWRTPPSGTPGTSTSAPPTTRSPGSPSERSSCMSR